MEYLRVRIGGGHTSVQQLLDGLPLGDHQADDEGNDCYLVATTNAGFLRFAIENQGYGEVLAD